MTRGLWEIHEPVVFGLDSENQRLPVCAPEPARPQEGCSRGKIEIVENGISFTEFDFPGYRLCSKNIVKL